MKKSLYHSVIHALKDSAQHNGNVTEKPEVIIWTDPDSQWEAVLPVLRESLPALLTYGKYDLETLSGPAIWIKCMVARELPEANWPESTITIIYLPAVSKNDLKRVAEVGVELQPLVEYQYTGAMFTQTNGRDWSILAFMENENQGLGLTMAQDGATKEALLQALPRIFQDSGIEYPDLVNADFLNSLMFPDVVPNILKWMCKAEAFLSTMSEEKREVFVNICKTRYHFEPDEKNIKDIALKLGSQKQEWEQVWNLYASAPRRYSEIEGLLRMAKPDDLGEGLFAMPLESWPQINEESEDELRKSLTGLAKLDQGAALEKLRALTKAHMPRVRWVWSELGYAPLANALEHLIEMASVCKAPFPSSSIDDLKGYYLKTGLIADQAMRKALAGTKTQKDKDAVKGLITLFYKPWLESITSKFQSLVEGDSSIFQKQAAFDEKDTFILFVDALRYELACEFVDRILGTRMKATMETDWVAIPSLTATSKSAVLPLSALVDEQSTCNEFRPQLKTGKDLQTSAFREAMGTLDFTLCTSGTVIDPEKKYWKEIGKIDSIGHDEQADLVRRTEELFEHIEESLELAFEAGFKRIKIVTDHGWLLLPDGLPKAELNKNLTETRWGRCALIKEGATTELLHLPWRWNPSVFIAYAPNITFFRKNVEYAHGGISIHECLIPVITVELEEGAGVIGKIEEFKWVGLMCRVTTADTTEGYSVDIRTKYNDPSTSIVLPPRREIQDNKVTLMVDDSAESHSAVVVLLDEDFRIMDKKPTLVGS
jgi:hypothetical protein